MRDALEDARDPPAHRGRQTRIVQGIDELAQDRRRNRLERGGHRLDQRRVLQQRNRERCKPCVERSALDAAQHAIALRALGLRPLLGLDLRLGEGTGALLALPLAQSAARALRDVATFDAAGVTEK